MAKEVLDSLSESALVSVDQGGNQALVKITKFPGPFQTRGYSTTFKFDEDHQVVATLTGLSPTITLDPTNAVDGTVIMFRAKTPTAITFSGINAEADPSSTAVDPTKMNVFILMYYKDWDGVGTPKVIYSNKLFTA